jgi:hypothetical protein
MKKIYIIAIALLLSPLTFNAQDTLSNWNFDGKTNLRFNQSHFENWAGGGINSFSGEANLHLELKHEKGDFSFHNSITQIYGVTKTEQLDKIYKNRDHFELLSKISLQHKKNTHFTFFVDLRTQIDKGVDPETNRRISNFFAPAFIMEGIGYEYRSADKGLSIAYSPVSGRHTLVLDNDIDETNYELDPGDKVRNEMGSYLRVNLEKQVFTNSTISSKMVLFSNYLENPENVDISWLLNFSLYATSWLSMSFETHLIYDDNINLEAYNDIITEGGDDFEGASPKLQFYESIGIGLVFNI